MANYIDLTGASGALYRFTVAEDARPTSPVAGVYAYIRQSKKMDPVVLHIGETGVLANGAAARWSEAVKEHDATHLYTRLNVARAARETEMADLVAAIDPVMNRPAAGQPD